jgi:hypothetical protein
MQEPSDGIAEAGERQLQLVLAAATIAARRANATRHHAIEQAQPQNPPHPRVSPNPPRARSMSTGSAWVYPPRVICTAAVTS